MRRFLSILCALLFLPALPVSAQKLLPNSFSGWTATSKANITAAQANGPQPAIAAEAAREYGFVSGEHASYAHGNDMLGVTVYRLQDPSGAYGEYSYLRTNDMPRADLTAHSSMSKDRALALTGSLVVEILGKDLEKDTQQLKTLVANVSKHTEVGLLPLIPDFLPTNDLVERSDHYILGPAVLNQFFPIDPGDWLGFAHGAEAETAQYKLDGRDVTLLLADYPTPQVAADELARMKNRMNINGSKPGMTPVLFAKRVVTKVAFISGAANEADADSLLNQIESGTLITWNEPTFQFKEPSIEMMIAGSIIGAGTICLFAMIAGLAFGGVRLVVKRILPDMVFDRSSHLQIMQMGLVSKPINSEDFYGIGGTPAPTAVIDRKLPDRTALRLFR